MCHIIDEYEPSPSQLPSTSDSSSSSPTIVSNFQDLSAVLSLFAADTVEKKISDPRANDLWRMSTTWSVFGIIGVVRTYIKFTAGIHSAERAGVDIYDLGEYTSKQTINALCVSEIGSRASRTSWQDDRRQLLGQVDAVGSRWKRPNIVVMGYSQCPFEGRKAFREIIGRSLSGAITVIITCLPLLVLRDSTTGDMLDNLTLGVAAGSTLVAGCFLPLLIQIINPVGVTHLRNLQIPNRFDHGVLQDGDTVITSRMSSTVFWQNRNEALLPRSGDHIRVRLLAGFAACSTIAAYLLNYIELGRVQTWKAYSWLGIQIAILAFRFILWATPLRVLANRPMTVLFFVAGSLVRPLDLHTKVSSRLHRDVVHFSVASAVSKVLNGGGNIGRLKLEALDLLSGVAPADILLAKYCEFDELTKMGGEIKAIRLPWSWVEEMYAAQGVILGRNPWTLGGLYLAAIVQDNTFQGLTTIHPIDAGADRAHGEDTLSIYSQKDPSLKDIVGITANNYGISGSLVIGVIGNKMQKDHDLMDWHAEFRENVHDCRSSAVSNGPPHHELHMRNFGAGMLGTKSASKTVPDIDGVLEQGLRIGLKEKEKDHAQCSEFCTIFGF
jgi:hypothetical protein